MHLLKSKFPVSPGQNSIDLGGYSRKKAERLLLRSETIFVYDLENFILVAYDYLIGPDSQTRDTSKRRRC